MGRLAEAGLSFVGKTLSQDAESIVTDELNGRGFRAPLLFLGQLADISVAGAIVQAFVRVLVKSCSPSVSRDW
jgi:hypothetical protein